MSLESFVVKRWYGKAGVLAVLKPLGLLVAAVSAAKKRQRIKNIHAPLPVIVVGNISVGGTGKTPMVVAIVEHLIAKGLKPGVVSRGYGGEATEYPYYLDQHSTSKESGDEPLLIYQRCNVPVCVAPDRRAAIEYLLDRSDCNIVVSDDGLQHYGMARSIEIAVIDGERGLGNGQLMPVGPLRESAKALAAVDMIVSNGQLNHPATIQLMAELQLKNRLWEMALQPETLEPLEPLKSEQVKRLDSNAPVLKDVEINAIAGIGNPERFFTTLKSMGYKPKTFAFADHHHYQAQDLQFGNEFPIVMTEKDAVKCRQLNPKNAWYLPVAAVLPQSFYQQLDQLLQETPLAQEIKP